MARWPGAIWQPVAQCSGTLRPIAVCLHHQAGNGNPASVYASRNVSAHFWLPKAAQPVQHVDTAVRAWHGGGTLNDTSIGVETEGCGSPPHAEPLTERQLNDFGALMAWANKTHGVPLVLSEAATTPGFNYHNCSGGFNTACPCDVRKNARAEILRRAGSGGGAGSTAPTQPTQQEVDDMALADLKTGGTWQAYPDGAVYALDGADYLGGTNNTKYNPQGKPCIGMADNNGDGYVLVVDFGSGGKRDPRTFRFPRNGSARV